MKKILPIAMVLAVVVSCASRRQDPTVVQGVALPEPLPREMASQEEQYAEAAVVAGIAATAQVVQKARSLDPDGVPMGELCCARCTEGYFPCGNECRPQGMIPPCLEPPGCACFDGENPDIMPPEGGALPPPIHTNQYPTAD